MLMVVLVNGDLHRHPKLLPAHFGSQRAMLLAPRRLARLGAVGSATVGHQRHQTDHSPLLHT